MGKKTTCIILVIVFLLFSCRGSVDNGHEEYVGLWISRDICANLLEITEGGEGNYRITSYHVGCKTGERFSGKVRFGRNVFYMGHHRFKIVRPPTATSPVAVGYQGKPYSATTYMILDFPIGHQDGALYKIK